MAKQETPKIYYRQLDEWFEVTEEEKREWERYTNTWLKKQKRYGKCCVPHRKSYFCDTGCHECEFCCTPESDHVLSIDWELERIYEGTSSYAGFISDKALTNEFSVDSVILNGIMADLKKSDPESYQILLLCSEGWTDRECAEKMNIPKNTYTYKRNKLFKAIRKKLV